MDERELKLTDPDGSAVLITVREADLRAGFKRGRLLRELISDDLIRDDPDLASIYAIYADLVAGTRKVDGMTWPVTADEFVALSDHWFDRVGGPWLQAVQELNPHWSPSYHQGEAPAAVG